MTPAEQTWPDDLARLYREKGYWRGETMSGFLKARARRYPDRIAIVDGERRLTYRGLEAEAERIGRGLLSLGFEPGERIIVQLPNIVEFLPVVFGLFRAGLLPVFALPAHRLAEIRHFAEKAEARGYIIADTAESFDYRGLARQVSGEYSGFREVIVVGEAQEFIGLDHLPQAAFLPEVPARPSDVAFLQISGGSTGLSKLIPRTHDDYIYSFRESAAICGLTESSVYMTALPAAHNFPMSSPGTFGTLYAGGTVVMCPSPSPETALPLIEKEQVTITGLVPPLALLWMQAAEITTADLSSLEVLLVGGAKFMPEAARRVRATLGCQLQQVFGMAEGLVNYTRLDDPDEIVINTQGRPISPDDEIRIIGADGKPVANGEAGELQTRGPYTIRAYHNEPAANARSFTADGFYRTGDVVRMTPEGYIVVEGRAVDHINRAGEKVSAEEIEDHLLAHPGVFDAAVVSLPDTYLGERSCAFVIAKGERPRPADLKSFMRQRGLAAFKIPDQIVFVPAFETTAVGKVSRQLLRRTLKENFLQSEKERA